MPTLLGKKPWFFLLYWCHTFMTFRFPGSVCSVSLLLWLMTERCSSTDFGKCHRGGYMPGTAMHTITGCPVFVVHCKIMRSCATSPFPIAWQMAATDLQLVSQWVIIRACFDQITSFCTDDDFTGGQLRGVTRSVREWTEILKLSWKAFNDSPGRLTFQHIHLGKLPMKLEWEKNINPGRFCDGAL